MLSRVFALTGDTIGGTMISFISAVASDILLQGRLYWFFLFGQRHLKRALKAQRHLVLFSVGVFTWRRCDG